tara:strand:+ start:603 stop:3893 length:3291 start_codon:yes stop_codon:yes gene_type:complete
MAIEDTNLLGKSHKDYVQKQILIRQQKLGLPRNQQGKTPQDIQWMNGKTSWVRLASSVDIGDTFYLQPAPKLSPEQQSILDMLETPQDTTNGRVVAPNITNDKLNEFYLNYDRKNPQSLEDAEYEMIPYFVDGKLTSEARLDLINLGPEYSGNELAKKLVFHGGVENAQITNTPEGLNTQMVKRKGISEMLGRDFDSVYQFGQFGARSIPGIQGFDCKSKSMGSLREANVTIRVNSSEDFELIDALYLRIGYSMFIEWGNSSYYDNEGKYIKGIEVDPGLLFEFLEPTPDLVTDYSKFIDKIESAREFSNGNYDALFGRLKNFTWEFDSKGYYNITLSIISWGDVIESLKINGLYPGMKPLSNLPERGEDSDLVETIYESALNTFIHEATVMDRTTVTSLTGTELLDNQSVVKSNLIAQVRNADLTGFSYASASGDYSDALDYDRDKTNSKGKKIAGVANFGENRTYYYVRFGDILDFIKHKLLLTNENGTPIIDINTTPTHNLCFNPGFNVSANPSKVMIARSMPLQETVDTNEDLREMIGEFTKRPNFDIFLGTIPDPKTGTSTPDIGLEPFNVTKIPGAPENIVAGDIMNIYFEKQYLLDIIKNKTDKRTGNLTLLTFVSSLLEDANDCLGGVNQLAVRVTDDRILEIYDQIPLYGIGSRISKQSDIELNVYGIDMESGFSTSFNTDGIPGLNIINYRAGSFVTNFTLKTELTNEFATITSIGAQANGSVVGEDASFLSKWNFGLFDRFLRQKGNFSSNNGDNSRITEKSEFDKALKYMYKLWVGYSIQQYGIKSKIYEFPEFSSIYNFEALVKFQKDYLQATIKTQCALQGTYSNQMGMLPIGFSYELDGLSGMRIYDQVAIDTRFLPSYYNDYLIFIVKGISHSFAGNRWVTNVETIAQPKVMFNNPKLSPSLGGAENSTPSENNVNDENINDDDITDLPFTLSNPLFRVTLNPNDFEIRGQDGQGNGNYGSSRDNGGRIHAGVDLVAIPGDLVVAPITGKLIVGNRVYSSDREELVLVKVIGTGDYAGYTAKIFYVVGNGYLQNTIVDKGAVIGSVQNMSQYYPPLGSMTNHIHYELRKNAKPVNPTPFL